MQDEMKPNMQGPVDDHEASMARSELYRAAKYSMKLFQMIQEGQDLEGWVQAKITKSADYLDSVYHYMEYQMKFGGGAQASSVDDITGDADTEINDKVSDMDDEEEFDVKKIDESMSYEAKLQALLEGRIDELRTEKKDKDGKVISWKEEGEWKKTGAKKDGRGKVTNLSDKARRETEKLGKEEKVDEASGVRASDKKKGKVDKSERKQYFVKLEKDNKTKGMTIVADEGEREGELRDRVKRDNIGWTVASIRVKDEIDEAAEKISEKSVSKKQQKFMGMVHAAKKGEKPASKEVAKVAKGMSKKDAEDFASTKHKGLPEKKAKKTDENRQVMSPPDGATAEPPKGKDGQYPIVTSGPHKGKRWSPQTPGPTNPNFKESSLVRNIVKKVVSEKKASNSKPDFLDMDKDGDKKEPMKKAVADKKENPFAKKSEKKESVNESADLDRMKQFLTRLNG
jgi:hypothetical protein